MDSTRSWILGGCVGVLGVIALYVAANAHDTAVYYIGLAVFVVCVLFDFYLIKRTFDRAERRMRAEHASNG